MSPSTTTTRWSPTPEQLMILEEMYKGGLRTPNATQIQKITSHLSFYGKIEGKNVFYWFQNHKARDRQKLRKKLILTKQLQFQQKFSQSSNIIINNYASSSDDVVLGLIDHPPLPPLPLPLPPPPSVADLHLHALHHEYDRYAEYLRLQGGTDDDGGTARLTNDGGNDDWMMMTTTTKKTVSLSSKTRDINAPVGPTWTLPCCTTATYYNNNYRPLKTLELFPVTSPSLTKERSIPIDGANKNVFF